MLKQDIAAGPGSNIITITGASNTIGGSCTATLTTTGQFSSLNIGKNVRTCSFKNTIDGNTYVTIKITEIACKAVAGDWLKTTSGSSVCVMKL